MEEESNSVALRSHKFFIGPDCLSCGACWKEAPDNFRSHDVDANAYVHRQPQSEKELQECKAAQEICPISIIGYAYE
ncbi:ferredoxin [Bdellovibrio sp.]|uniref:ferredoxin n=1 Tax=Bdellovibrio TaxID=958 RepID=UPI003221E99B